MKKKILATMLVAAMVLSVAGCKKKVSGNTENSSAVSDVLAQNETETSKETDSKDIEVKKETKSLDELGFEAPTVYAWDGEAPNGTCWFYFDGWDQCEQGLVGNLYLEIVQTRTDKIFKYALLPETGYRANIELPFNYFNESNPKEKSEPWYLNLGIDESLEKNFGHIRVEDVDSFVYRYRPDIYYDIYENGTYLYTDDDVYLSDGGAAFGFFYNDDDKTSDITPAFKFPESGSILKLTDLYDHWRMTINWLSQTSEWSEYGWLQQNDLTRLYNPDSTETVTRPEQKPESEDAYTIMAQYQNKYGKTYDRYAGGSTSRSTNEGSHDEDTENGADIKGVGWRTQEDLGNHGEIKICGYVSYHTKEESLAWIKEYLNSNDSYFREHPADNNDVEAYYRDAIGQLTYDFGWVQEDWQK